MLHYKLAVAFVVLFVVVCNHANPVVDGSQSKDEQWLEAWDKLAALEKRFEDNSDCKCIKFNCGCCVALKIPKLHVDSHACVNVSYLPHDIGIRVTFSLDKHVYINTTISATDPPPLCVGIPDLHKQASICLKFYDMDYTKTELSGCVKLEAKLLHITLLDVRVGCFNFPLLQLMSTEGDDVSRLPVALPRPNGIRGIPAGEQEQQIGDRL